jgi:hypothetical protein
MKIVLARIALPRLLRVFAPVKAKFTSVGIILVVVSTLTQSVDLALNKMSDIEETPIETYNDVEPEFTGDANTTEVKLFGKWSFDDIEVRDISLEVSIFYSSLVT